MKFLIIAALVTAVVANDIIDGEWMVKIKLDVDQDALSRLLKHSFAVDVQNFFNFPTLALMHVKANEADITRARQLSEILLVEPNQRFYANQACGTPSGHPGVWGLDRIDQTAALQYSNPADGSAEYGWVADGSGTTAHVCDTGIRDTHVEFAGRATFGYAAPGLPSIDDNGHGTHCAGTIGSNAYGVAKGVSLVASKCLNSNGSGSTADVVASIEWSSGEETGQGNADTINLSLGGGASTTLDAAVAAAVDLGTTVVCAAGNSDADACNSSPGREPTCFTVGATEVDDQTATYTNFGSCVDIFAPGTDILSCWINSDTDTNRISGTSMACPHVVGACNLYIQRNGRATPAAVKAGVTGAATSGAINFRPGHSGPDALLFAC